MDNEILYQKTLEYVLRSPKTERQVRDWLFKKRKESEFIPIDEIISRLKESNYINDADYAARFAEAKQNKYGMRVVKNKLAAKGIAREHFDEIETPDQSELCKKLAAKYMRNKITDTKTLQKLYRFLLNKGLTFEIASSIISEIKSH